MIRECDKLKFDELIEKSRWFNMVPNVKTFEISGNSSGAIVDWELTDRIGEDLRKFDIDPNYRINKGGQHDIGTSIGILLRDCSIHNKPLLPYVWAYVLLYDTKNRLGIETYSYGIQNIKEHVLDKLKYTKYQEQLMKLPKIKRLLLPTSCFDVRYNKLKSIVLKMNDGSFTNVDVDKLVEILERDIIIVNTYTSLVIYSYKEQ